MKFFNISKIISLALIVMIVLVQLSKAMEEGSSSTSEPSQPNLGLTEAQKESDVLAKQLDAKINEIAQNKDLTKEEIRSQIRGLLEPVLESVSFIMNQREMILGKEKKDQLSQMTEKENLVDQEQIDERKKILGREQIFEIMKYRASFLIEGQNNPEIKPFNRRLTLISDYVPSVVGKKVVAQNVAYSKVMATNPHGWDIFVEHVLQFAAKADDNTLEPLLSQLKPLGSV